MKPLQINSFAFILFILNYNIYSQGMFVEKTYDIPVPDVNWELEVFDNGHLTFGDVDGDGDQDLFAIGESGNDYIFNLYLNDGSGNFSVSNGFSYQHFAFSPPMTEMKDFNGDGHLDILTAGGSLSNPKLVRIFINDGAGNFTEDTAFQTDVFHVVYGLEADDLDGDGSMDIYISGQTQGGDTSLILFNNGVGAFNPFSVNQISSFPNIDNLKVLISDFDADGDNDILRYSNQVYEILENDGAANFTISGLPFLDTVAINNLTCVDLSGDGVLDFICYASDNSSQPIIFSAINNNAGGYVITHHYQPVSTHHKLIYVMDTDSDNDIDFFLYDDDQFYLYKNDGNANFTQSMLLIDEIGLYEIDYGGQYFPLDINNDGNEDFIHWLNYNSNSAKQLDVYLGDGNDAFYLADENRLTNSLECLLETGDIDNDGDLDLLSTGYHYGSPYDMHTMKYLNNGDGTFVRFSAVEPSMGMSEGVFILEDLNGDGFLDLFMNGRTSANNYDSRKFINDGNGGFYSFNSTDIPPYEHGGGIITDHDGDGEQEIILSGFNHSSNNYNEIYIYNEIGNTTMFNGQQLNLPFVMNGIFDAEDVNGDGNMDYVIAGHFDLDSTFRETRVFISNNNIYNSPSINLNLPEPNVQPTIKFIDLDADGDQDIISYTNWTGDGFQFFLNDGTGSYHEDFFYNMDTIVNGEIKVADFNNDNYDDFMVGSGDVFINQRDKSFLRHPQNLRRMTRGDVTIGDVNNDGFEDIISVGAEGNNPFSRVYINDLEPLSVEENQESKWVNVYPNPTQDWIRLSSKNTNSSCVVYIYNTLGELVSQVENNEISEFELDISSFSKGYYTGKIVFEDRDPASFNFVVN